MPSSVIEILESCPWLRALEGPPFARLISIARLVKFRKGQHIFRQGEPCPGMYVVGNGSVRIFKTGSGGKEHTLHFVGPGQTFAEVAALGNFPLPACAEALSSTTCALLPTEPFRKALAEDHRLCLGLLEGMAGWVRSLVGLIEDIVLRDAMSRVAQYLLARPATEDGRIVLPGLKRHIASHLNLTSETLSRCMSRLENQGLILRKGSRCLQLLQRKQLRKLAEGFTPRF